MMKKIGRSESFHASIQNYMKNPDPLVPIQTNSPNSDTFSGGLIFHPILIFPLKIFLDLHVTKTSIVINCRSNLRPQTFIFDEPSQEKSIVNFLMKNDKIYGKKGKETHLI
jgi:hypothetical protein